MKITILSLFPDAFASSFNYSIIKRAIDKGFLSLDFVNLREFGLGPHKIVDDRPYGGGVGMIMKVDVMASALASSKYKVQNIKFKERTVLMDPKGKKFDQSMARRFSKLNHLVLVCGHYEGVDERVNKLVDETVSIGNYILTGGEIPAMVIVDCVARLIPGVLAKKEAIKLESFTKNLLEYPQYTRPELYKKMKVPPVLLSGNHKKIESWREKGAKRISLT